MTDTQTNGSKTRPVPADFADNGFFGRDVLSVKQFDRKKLDHICQVADEMRSMVERFGSADLLQGKVLANLFYEPSTRTSSSFAAAMMRLGGKVISINEVRYSSVSKGESLPDTVRTLESYADVVVLRHPEVGAAAKAAHYARKPLINAGDGVGEHPTQALLDFYTIRRELGQVDGLNVAMVGDLKYGRTVHSLVTALSRFECRQVFISPPALRVPPGLIAELEAAGVGYEQSADLAGVLPELDILYCTRIQQERFADSMEYERVKGTYRITRRLLAESGARESLRIMHPLPRVDELSPDLDSTPHAVYFEQARNGVPVRQALLAMALGKAG